MGQVSASTESVQVTIQPIPSAEDCGTGSDSVVDRWLNIMNKYETRVSKNIDYTLDDFKSDMNSVLTKPELINCRLHLGGTVAHIAVGTGSVEGAKWAVSKGVDLTLRSLGFHLTKEKDLGGSTAYTQAAILCYGSIFCGLRDINNRYSAERKSLLNRIATILKPPPAPATKSCAEVDGQTPLPANEYCIVAENVQSSRQIEVWSDMEKRWIGDYRYEADKSLSGTGFYPGWKAEITFTCSSAASSGCGYADYSLPSNLTPEYRDIWDKAFKERYGINVFCDGSIDVLGLDRDLEPGESMSITYSSDLERSAPRFVNCKAIALDPFTLTVKTTRLAQ